MYGGVISENADNVEFILDTHKQKCNSPNDLYRSPTIPNLI
jgi:hypothetical protein